MTCRYREGGKEKRTIILFARFRMGEKHVAAMGRGEPFRFLRKSRRKRVNFLSTLESWKGKKKEVITWCRRKFGSRPGGKKKRGEKEKAAILPKKGTAPTPKVGCGGCVFFPREERELLHPAPCYRSRRSVLARLPCPSAISHVVNEERREISSGHKKGAEGSAGQNAP